MLKSSFIVWLLGCCCIFSIQAQQIGIKPDNNSVLIESSNLIKPAHPLLFSKSTVFSKQDSVVLFKTMPNSYQPKQSLPLFCEIEHQLSKLIKRRVKLGVP